MNMQIDNSVGNLATTRDKVFAAEEYMKTLPSAVDQCKLVHHFSKGIYARELHIPAGILLTGQIHKYPQLNILSKGRMSVLTEEGVREVEAPFTVSSPAGTKRIAYAHTDCVWTTILPTDETDIEEIEKYFIAKDENEWLEFAGKTQLELGLF